MILSGEVTIEGQEDAAAAIARAGDVFGTITTLAGRPLGRAAQVTRGGLALRLERDDLFALLGERPELLRQMFSGLFRAEARV